MTARLSTGLVALSVTGLLLAGCGGSGNAGSRSNATSSASRSTSSSGGAHTGSAGHAHSTPASPTATEQTPSQEAANLASAPAPAAMVCSKEVRENIAKLLNLPKLPQGKATWANHRYTCSYDLAAGHLVLTVQESSDDAAAKSYLKTARASYAGTRTITGLQSFGLPAFENSTGITGFVKDNFTLVVDASHLSGRLGQHSMSRSSFSYSLASDVIACWSE
jgi:hypothetical protein